MAGNSVASSAGQERPITSRLGVDVLALGAALSLFLILSVFLCVVAANVLPDRASHFLARLVPAFDWRAPPAIALAIELSLAWSWFAALVAGIVYNYTIARHSSRRPAQT